MTDLEDMDLPVAVGAGSLNLRLRRYHGSTRTVQLAEPHVVLFVHGGNSRSDTFLLPDGGVVRYLWEAGFDVWLLDWRGSPYVLEQLRALKEPIGGSAAAERSVYTLDDVVDQDIPCALGKLRGIVGDGTRLSVVAHCLGAGIVSMAMGCGKLEPFKLSNVVLSTLGLFFEVPWNCWMKAEDFILERVITTAAKCRWIDPKAPREWPTEMVRGYARWPHVWNASGTSPSDELLKRLTFMVGRPFAIERLHPSINGELLAYQFGPLHLGLYLHSSQIIRRGYAGMFNEPDVIDRRRARRPAALPLQTSRYFETQYWSSTRVTLIGGAEDQVWHRDSVDLMYEWLRGPASGSQKVTCSKHIVRGYRLQELYWAQDAKRDVYPLFRDALR